jgi:hypothetical protein
MWPPFSWSLPLFDDHMECEKWSNVKNIAFFEPPDQKNVCFDMSHVYSAIRNHRIHLTTFFMLMTTVWWPLECEKWSNVKNIAFFELPDQKNVYFDMPQVYSTKKRGGGHDHINLKYDPKSGLDHNFLLSSIKNIQYLGVSYIFRTF